MDVYTRNALEALSRRRWFIAGMAGLGLLVGLLMDWLIWVPGHQAEVELVIESPALGENGAAQYLPEVYHARAYIDLLESDTVIGAVRQRLIEQNLWDGESNIPDLDSFANRFSIEASVLDQTTRPVTYAPFLTLRTRAQTEAHARAYADMWAEVGIGMSRNALGLSTRVTLDTIGRKLAGHEADLAAVWDALEEHQRSANRLVLENELLSLVARIDEVRSWITEMEAVQAGQGKRYEFAQQRLAEESPTIRLFSAPSTDAYWLLQELRRDGESVAEDDEPTHDGMADELNGRGFVNEVINEPYVVLQYEAALAQMGEAEATATLVALNTRLEELEAEKRSVQVALAEHERAQRELMAKEEALHNIYTQVLGVFTYGDVAAELVGQTAPNEAMAMGINRLTEEVYVREVSGLLDFRTRIMLLTVLGLLLGILWVVYEAVSPVARRSE